MVDATAQLFTQSRIISDVDTLVVDQNACAGALETIGEFGYDDLLRFQYLNTWQIIHLRKNDENLRGSKNSLSLARRGRSYIAVP